MAKAHKTTSGSDTNFFTRPPSPDRIQSVPVSFCPVHNLPTRFRLVLPNLQYQGPFRNDDHDPRPPTRRSNRQILRSDRPFDPESDPASEQRPSTVTPRGTPTAPRRSRVDFQTTVDSSAGRSRDSSVPVKNHTDNRHESRERSRASTTRRLCRISRGATESSYESDSNSVNYRSKRFPSVDSESRTLTRPAPAADKPPNPDSEVTVSGYSNRKATVTQHRLEFPKPRTTNKRSSESRRSRSQAPRTFSLTPPTPSWRSPSASRGSQTEDQDSDPRRSRNEFRATVPLHRSRTQSRDTVAQRRNTEYFPTVVRGPRTEYRAGMSVFGWGFGKLGQLGNGRTESSDLPVELRIPDTMDRPAKVYTGALFTAILTQKGDVYVCGCGKYGRLGNGSEEDISELTRIIPARDAKVSQVAAGSWHGCAVTFLGRLYTWGYNSKHNVLGRDCDQRCSLVPGLVPSLTSHTVKEVSCGHNFSLLATTDGEVYSWGCGRYGVLGHGHQNCVLKPTKIESLSMINIVSVNAGYAHCGAVSDDGRLYMFGKGGDGALGLGEEMQNRSIPNWIKHTDFISQHIIMVRCTVGEHRGHTLALTDQGIVYSWGSNYKGKLGLGDTENRFVPTKIPSTFFLPESENSITNGNSHIGNFKNGGTMLTRIGSRRRSAPASTNGISRLKPQPRPPPKQLTDDKTKSADPATYDISYSNSTKPMMNRTSLDGITALNLNGYFSNSLTDTNGSVAPLTINGRNGLTTKTSTDDKSLVSINGSRHTSENGNSPTSNTSKATRVVKISSGGVHSGAVTEDGRVFTWGCGKDGRLGHPEIEAMPKTYHCTKPKEVVAMRDAVGGSARIGVDISCSHYHTVVLLDFPR